MELSKEFIDSNGLNEEQVKSVSEFYNEEIIKIKGDYDSKANDNAEGILEGAVRYANEQRGLNITREKGEKWGDFLGKFTDASVSETEKALETKSRLLDDKLKNFEGSNSLKKELEEAKKTNDDLLKKFADYDDLKTKAEQYDPLVSEYSSMKLKVAFSKIKPNFPKESNIYEVDAKWGDFEKDVLDKYNIEIENGEPLAIDKDNVHRKFKLSELVSKNEELNKLLNGRQQGGTNSEQIELLDFDGVPFKVTEDMKKDSVLRSKAIRDYLATQNIEQTSDKYPTEFSKYNSLILNGKQKIA